jgi:glycosyltransferase involved in cell wall biosynthesis
MPTAEAASARPRRHRVWIVNHYADAPDRPSGTRHYDLAQQLIGQGREVTIFAAGFSHVTGRDERMRGARLSRTETFDGVRFVWLRTVSYRGNTARRSINMLSFAAVFLLVQWRSARPDAVIGSTVHPFAAFAAWIAAKLRRAIFLYEVRDLWPQTLVDLGAIRDGSPGERSLRWIEAFLVRRASAVITLLPGMRDYLAGRGLPTDRVVYIPNGVDLERFDEAVAAGTPGTAGTAAAAPASPHGPADVALARIRATRDAGRFAIGYVGAFGRVNELGVIVRAAMLAERREPGRISLTLIGDGPERAGLVALAGSDPAIAFGAAIPKRDVPRLLAALDGTVVHATETPVYRYGISFNKLFEYLAAGRPVVFACASAYDPVGAEGAGLSIPPDDPEALADAMLTLAATPEAERQAMGRAGRSVVERDHDMAALGARLGAALDGELAP